MLSLIIATFLSMTSAHAGDVGFSTGNSFTASSVEGVVAVTCEGFNGTATARYTCRDVVLEPSPYDYIVGPKFAEARRIDVRAVYADGSSRTKMSFYDGVRGISKDSFNLWISTLFQKPLLQVGVNKIQYSIYSDDKRDIVEYARGEFTVQVDRGAARRCPSTSYNSTDVNDCNSQYSVCQRYFEQYNNCK